MKPITFQEAWRRITTAYANNELNPISPCGCFIGNLLNGATQWTACRWNHGELREDDAQAIWSARMCIERETGGAYTVRQIVDLERLFMGYFTWEDRLYCTDLIGNFRELSAPDGYEDRLFRAVETTLSALRDIHIAKGGDVDLGPVRRRTLA